MASKSSEYIKLNITVAVISVLMLIMLRPLKAVCADRLYFISLVEHQGGNPQILLEWGPLEGTIPDEIIEFRLYRAESGGSFQPVEGGPIPHFLVSAEVLRNIVLSDLDEGRKNDLLETLNIMDPGINSSNFHEHLYKILNPQDDSFNPLQRVLLIRRYPAIAMAAGLAYMDTHINPGQTYSYLLTAYTDNGSETLPLGRTDPIDPAIETVLPAPSGFRQVMVFGCSELRKSLDDLRIYFTWYVPSQPSELGLQVMTYGYDLFWSENDLGPLNLRNGIPDTLFRVNEQPIVVSGPPPEDGPDSYLARDTKDSHAVGPPWKRGQIYYYYLVARDLAGHYSGTTPALEAEVVDAQPPVTPWNVHTEEIKDVTDKKTPRLALVWDQVNSINYIRYYGPGKTICSIDEDQICSTVNDAPCTDDSKKICVDVSVDHYRIFRFNSPETASLWGLDTDGDFWPDAVEKQRETDPCDEASHPPGLPFELVQTINQNNTAFHRTPPLSSDHIQMYFVDRDILPDNKVHWYRIVAVDEEGNQSPLSPPARAVLFDRSQPSAQATLTVKDCTYSANYVSTCPEQDISKVLTLIDTTSDATSFELFQFCEQPCIGLDNPCVKTSDQFIYRSLVKWPMNDSITHLDINMLEKFGCTPRMCWGKILFVVRFYAADERMLAESEPFVMKGFCNTFNGCVYLNKHCLWEQPKPSMLTDTPIRICAELQEGQMARIYHLIGGSMSPLATIDAASADGQYCKKLSDFEGMVPADICLGIRVFSKNHVGSAMHYFDCIKTKGSRVPPPAPLIEGIESKKDDLGSHIFEVRWACHAEGLAAFVINYSNNEDLYYTSVWDLSTDATGQFSHTIPLMQEDLNKKWCFKIRAVDTAMQRSEWSETRCARWEVGDPPNLPWPPVSEPPEGEKLTAFYILADPPSGGKLPAIVLSDDLTGPLKIRSCPDPTGDCLDPCCLGLECHPDSPKVCDPYYCSHRKCIKTCNGQECIYDGITQFYSLCDPCPGFCSVFRSQIKLDTFIVYRQEEGKDFVQVGPLIEGFFCYIDKFKVATTEGGETDVEMAILHDPFILVRNFQTGAIGGGGEVPSEKVLGIRLFYLDRYPHRSGTKIRYKVLAMDRETGEIERVHTTNWVEIL